MRRRLEDKISLYRDGELPERERGRVEKRVARDPLARSYLGRVNWLGKRVRDSWKEGPPAPSPEYLISTLRPQMDRVDRELRSERLSRGLAWLRHSLRPAPSFALAGAVALLLFVTLPVEPPTEVVAPEAVQPAPRAIAIADRGPLSDTPIYDLAEGDSPLMILEGADGSTLIWILDEPDQLSYGIAAEEWA